MPFPSICSRNQLRRVRGKRDRDTHLSFDATVCLIECRVLQLDYTPAPYLCLRCGSTLGSPQTRAQPQKNWEDSDRIRSQYLMLSVLRSTRHRPRTKVPPSHQAAHKLFRVFAPSELCCTAQSASARTQSPIGIHTANLSARFRLRSWPWGFFPSSAGKQPGAYLASLTRDTIWAMNIGNPYEGPSGPDARTSKSATCLPRKLPCPESRSSESTGASGSHF
ncbi:hypothetical protein LXA43DRAFT_524836 [Ganoderma leucocontextum]|nr:hypothetical protein LXA43DRAFT_524836 [Ganoderma leucocontextum]